MPIHDIRVGHLPQEADARRQPEASAVRLETRALGAVPCDERGEGEALPSQHGAGVDEKVHALLRAQAADDPDDGPPKTAGEGGDSIALRWVACRRRGQGCIVDDANPAAAMAERSGLSLRHDDNALGRTEQPPVDPVIESVLEVLGCGTMRSEEHTSELQSLAYLVCRLLLEKKKR